MELTKLDLHDVLRDILANASPLYWVSDNEAVYDIGFTSYGIHVVWDWEGDGDKAKIVEINRAVR